MNLNIEQFLAFIKDNTPNHFHFYISKKGDESPNISPTEFWFEKNRYYFNHWQMVRKKNRLNLKWNMEHNKDSQFYDKRKDFIYPEKTELQIQDRLRLAKKILQDLQEKRLSNH
jgi:hypothetical protein